MSLIKQSLIVLSLLIVSATCFASEKKQIDKKSEFKDNKRVVEMLKNKKLVNIKPLTTGTRCEDASAE